MSLSVRSYTLEVSLRGRKPRNLLIRTKIPGRFAARNDKTAWLLIELRNSYQYFWNQTTHTLIAAGWVRVASQLCLIMQVCHSLHLVSAKAKRPVVAMRLRRSLTHSRHATTCLPHRATSVGSLAPTLVRLGSLRGGLCRMLPLPKDHVCSRLSCGLALHHL